MTYFETYSSALLPLLERKNGNTTDGAMVALFIDPTIGMELALPGGLPVNQLHITLLSFGDAEDFNEGLIAASCTPRMLRRGLADIAASCAHVRGSVSGVGCFSVDNGQRGSTAHVHDVYEEGQRPFIALVDIPHIHKIHHELEEFCKANNIPYQHNHGFTPHITLRYLAPEEQFPTQSLPKLPLEFNGFTLTIATRRLFFPFKEK